MTLNNQVAIITGGAQGIGKATAWQLAQQGATVVLADIQDEKSQTTADEIAAEAGATVIAIPTDVSNPEQVDALVVKTVEQFERVDILVNNAGNQRVGATTELPLDSWLEVLSVHLTGAFLCCRAVGKVMIEQHYGAVVNMASAAAYVSLPERLPYCTAKAGLIGLTQSLAVEWARYGIRVNAVAPGYTKTELLQQVIDSGALNETVVSNTNALNRMGTPEEVGKAIAFLCSPDASFITGHTLLVDGAFIHYKGTLDQRK